MQYWKEEDISLFLNSLSLPELFPVFLNNGINCGKKLCDLQRLDLQKKLQIKNLGARKKIWRYIEQEKYKSEISDNQVSLEVQHQEFEKLKSQCDMDIDEVVAVESFQKEIEIQQHNNTNYQEAFKMSELDQQILADFELCKSLALFDEDSKLAESMQTNGTTKSIAVFDEDSKLAKNIQSNGIVVDNLEENEQQETDLIQFSHDNDIQDADFEMALAMQIEQLDPPESKESYQDTEFPQKKNNDPELDSLMEKLTENSKMEETRNLIFQQDLEYEESVKTDKEKEKENLNDSWCLLEEQTPKKIETSTDFLTDYSMLNQSNTKTETQICQDNQPSDPKQNERLSRATLFATKFDELFAKSDLQVNTCTACQEETQCYDLPCEHYYCEDCIKRKIKLSLNDINDLPTRCCGIEIDEALVSKFLEEEELDKYFTLSNENHLGSKMYCANERCSSLIDLDILDSVKDEGVSDSFFACSDCGEALCMNCKQLAHHGVSCSQALKNIDNPKLLGGDYRQCASCSKFIEKFEGCNHITCACSYQFCWLCGTPWPLDKTTCSKGCHLFEDPADPEPEEKQETNLTEPGEHEIHQFIRQTVVAQAPRCEDCNFSMTVFYFICRTCNKVVCRQCS